MVGLLWPTMNSSSASTSSDTTVDISTSEYVYVGLTALTAVLSIVGGTAICVLHFAFRDLRRSSGRRLLLYLAFSDAFLAFGNLLGVIWYLYRDSDIINKSKGYCDFQSAMTIYFSITSFSWTVIMGVCIFVTVVRGKLRFTKANMKTFHVISWIPAGEYSVVVLTTQARGQCSIIICIHLCPLDEAYVTIHWKTVMPSNQ